jgi:hypothetical protein
MKQINLVKLLNEAQSEDLISQLTAMASKGELTTTQINDLTHSLRTALRKHQVSKRTPDSYKAAAEKAKATREKSAADLEKQRAEYPAIQARRNKQEEDRRAAGLLPTELNLNANIEDTFPDIRKYYDQKASSDGFLTLYMLRRKYQDTPVENAEQFWKYKRGGINEVKRMQQLAGILKENSYDRTDKHIRIEQ